MPTLFIKDDLRAAVEAASGGRQTVLYTAKGQPSYMNVVPRFNLEDLAEPGVDLGKGPHPAFIVNGVEKSEFFYGAYCGVIKNGELLSLPNTTPERSRSFDTFSNAARANGLGWHLGSNAEWAALMLWCHRNGFIPRGNDQYGRSSDAPYESGRRVLGEAIGDTAAEGPVLTGSGPCGWRHDNTHAGIADLCGNVWEWQGGLRLVDGEIHIIPNNDAVNADLSTHSGAWRAIRLSNGALVAPGSPGTAKLDSPTATNQGNGGVPILAEQIANRTGAVGANSNDAGHNDGPFGALKEAKGLPVPVLLKVLGLYRHKELSDSDRIHLRNYGERLPIRGGNWGSGTTAGLRTLGLADPRSHVSTSVGGRPAFVL